MMNAIILAAEMGSRLRPLTNHIPKCLVEVNGEPMIERQLRFLSERGVKNITIVSGYKSETLEYLKGRYGVDIVFNERYESVNNIYSMFKVLDRIGNSYVIEGDIYMRDNCFISEGEINKSTYFAVRKSYDNEWGLNVDESMALKSIDVGSGDGYIMSGISYWTCSDGKKIANEVKRLIESGNYEDLFWDNAVCNLLGQMEIHVSPTNSLYEIDTVADLRALERRLNNMSEEGDSTKS